MLPHRPRAYDAAFDTEISHSGAGVIASISDPAKAVHHSQLCPNCSFRLSGHHCTAGSSVPAAHTAEISHLAFDSDGGMLVTVGFDSSTMLWDVADPATGPVRLGTPLTTPDNQWINATFGSGDRFVLVGADYNAQPVLYDYSKVEHLHRDPAGMACAIAGGGLTRTEWNTYLPEEPYRDTCHDG